MSRSCGCELHDYSLPEEAREVLIACGRDRSAEHIHVRPLGRFGYTGAKLFLARFDTQGRGAPYVVKIDNIRSIEREWSSMQKAQAFFYDAMATMTSLASSDSAAIIYKLFSSPDGKITELRELYEGDSPDAEVCGVLERLYDSCAIAHAPTAATGTLGAEYEWYLRRERPDRVSEAFGGDTGEPISLFGEKYHHPVTTVAKVGESATSTRAFVHGDLHPNNVVLNEHGLPALIDFAWAHEGDLYADYVLMECSLRFLLFPRNVLWPEHHWVASRLTLEDGAEEVRERYASTPGLALEGRYLRMAKAVEVVRRRAKQHAGAMWSHESYLSAQVMVLSGLSRLSVYPFFASVDALGLIGNRLLGEAK